MPSDGCGHYCLLYVLTTTCLHVIILFIIHENIGIHYDVTFVLERLTASTRHRVQLKITGSSTHIMILPTN